jgi:hypothetical protein
MRGAINCSMFDDDYSIQYTTNVTGSANEGRAYEDWGYVIAPSHPPANCDLNITARDTVDKPYYSGLVNYRSFDFDCPAYAVYIGYLEPELNDIKLSMFHCSPYI